MQRIIQRTVYPLADGTWMNRREGFDRESDTYPSQEAALRAARQLLRTEGGGEVIAKDRNGQVTSIDVVPPALL